MKKSGLLNLVIILVLLLSCPLLAQEKTNDPGYPVKQLASESLDSQRYGPARYGSEAEGHDSCASDSEHYQYGQYGPLGYGTESEGQ
jgi:hypothetical protein